MAKSFKHTNMKSKKKLGHRISFSLSLVTLLFLTIVSHSIAQQSVSEFLVRIKDPEDALGVADTNGTIAYFFDGHKQYQATIINANNEVERNVSVNKLPSNKRDKLISILLNEKVFSAFFYNKKLKTLSSVTLDRSTGDYKSYPLKVLAKDEFFLRGFAMNNHFYMLTVPKQENILNLHESINGMQTISSKYTIEFPEFYQLLSSKNDKLNIPAESEIGIEVISGYLDNNVKSGYPQKKLYHLGRNIIMTFDDASSTHLITIDTEQKKSFYKRLNFTLEQGNLGNQKNGNSFLLDKNLFRVTMSHEQMNLSIINIDSMALLNNYNFYPETGIDILNSPIIQDNESNSLFGDGDGKEISRTKQYFNKVLDGNISIAANKLDSGRVEIEVGSYEETIYRNNGFSGPGGLSMGMGMGMGMGYGGMGGFGYPMYSPFGMMGGYPGYYPYNNATATVVRKVVSFKSMINDYNYGHIKGQLPKTIRERASEYMGERFKNGKPDLYCISYCSDASMLMGFYLKNKNQFSVVEFSRFGNAK